MILFSRYAKWITLFATVLLIISCFMPWAYYPDLDKSFTGFFSERNIYGKPAKLLISFSVFGLIAHFANLLFLHRTNLLLMALMLAYAIKSFIVFGSCYQGICPVKQGGIYLMLFSALLLMGTALFPSGKPLKG